MNYLICQDWSNTSSNHAGMKYLCSYLEKKYPNDIRTIVINKNKHKPLNNKILNRIAIFLRQREHNTNIKKIRTKLFHRLNSNDRVFLMEYFDPSVNQYLLSKFIREKLPNVKIYGMTHLVPQKIERMFSENKLMKWNNAIDKIITLGSSLTNYYISRGIAKDRIITTFHYIDDYYITEEIKENDTLEVIAMGNQMRNTDLLVQIVQNNPDIHFTICQGLVDMSPLFKTTNVTLVPFIPENKLKDLMSKADVSLNVMQDTIGSNVIVTSMGMGLAMVCSDVGSIRDYCDSENTIFCKTLEEFNKALNNLKENKPLLKKMKYSAKEKSLDFSIEKFYHDVMNKL